MPGTIVEAEKLRESALLEKVYNGNKDSMEKDILEMLQNETAGNRLSAINKLIRQKGTVVESKEGSAAGRFALLYKKRPGEDDIGRGYSVYVLNKNGTSQTVHTVHIPEKVHVPAPDKEKFKNTFGEVQNWTNLEVQKNVFTGKTFYSATPQTRIEAFSGEIPKLWNIAQPVDKISNGLGLYGGYISGFFTQNKYVDGERTEETMPIISMNGEANLSVAITNKVNEKTGAPERGIIFVSVSSEKQLRELIGDALSDEELLSENATRELGDAFKAAPVLVFGRGSLPGSVGAAPNQKRITLNIGGGLGRIAIVSDDK